jgi:hypothetical protein
MCQSDNEQNSEYGADKVAVSALSARHRGNPIAIAEPDHAIGRFIHYLYVNHEEFRNSSSRPSFPPNTDLTPGVNPGRAIQGNRVKE